MELRAMDIGGFGKQMVEQLIERLKTTGRFWSEPSSEQ